MASVIDLYNQAVSLAGGTAKLTATSDKTREAELCNLYYEDVRANVFSAAYWNSLRRTTTLNLIVERDYDVDWETTDPVPDWRFAYRLPADHVRPRYLSNFPRFALESLGNEVTLQTMVEAPILTYTALIEDVSRWEPLLRTAIVAALAYKLAIGFKVNADLFNRVRDNLIQTNATVLTLQANVDNPIQIESIPDWLAAREGIIPIPPIPFYYQSQALINGSGQILI